MPSYLVLFAFWPGVTDDVQRALVHPHPERSRGRVVPFVTGLDGPFDALAAIDAPGTEDAASAALGLAAVLAGDRARGAGRDRITYEPPELPAAERDPTAFTAQHGLTGTTILRARDGWVAVNVPDRGGWLAFTSAFLRKRIYTSVPFDAAWHSPVVNDLATIVLDTHDAEDVEGTCQTYGVPCRALRDWDDNAQGTLEGKPARLTTSAWLSDQLRYAAILEAPEVDPAGLPEDFRARAARLLARAGAPITIPAHGTG